MTTITREIYGMTVGELKELLKDIDDSVQIQWDDIGGAVWTVELEIDTYEHSKPIVCFNIDVM